jgi:hypothetical protein
MGSVISNVRPNPIQFSPSFTVSSEETEWIRHKYNHLIGATLRYNNHKIDLTIQSISFGEERITIQTSRSIRYIGYPVEIKTSLGVNRSWFPVFPGSLLPLLQQSITCFPNELCTFVVEYLSITIHVDEQWKSLDRWFEPDTYDIYVDQSLGLRGKKKPKLGFLLEAGMPGLVCPATRWEHRYALLHLRMTTKDKEGELATQLK